MASPLPGNPVKPRRPIDDFPILFAYQDRWVEVFDHLTERVRNDIARARAAGKFVIYLSCPVSKRGGGDETTNVEVARFVTGRIYDRFGDRFWVLNPSLYQHQSGEGDKLLAYQATKATRAVPDLNTEKPKGEDYMRMWTRVLVGDKPPPPKEGEPSRPRRYGGDVDAFYFVGPSDVHAFFLEGQQVTLSTAIENYFARKCATDIDFRNRFESKDDWKTLRDGFVRFYALRASAAFSKGSHDEWNILVKLNELRLVANDGDVGELIAGYFDGAQVELASASPTAAEVIRGYAGKDPGK
jgi:hypothetical protein